MRNKKFLFFLLTSFVIFIVLALNAAKKVESNSGYIGADACKRCHEEIYNSAGKQSHGKKAVADSPANKNECESCHGPGAAHVGAGGGRGAGELRNFSKSGDPAAKSAVCLSCHEEQKTQTFWNVSKHKSAGVSCDSCHAVHGGKEKLVKQKDPDICFTCHRDIKSQANRQSHHPIKEGKVKCADCHDQHGDMLRADTVNELCYKCHADKRGPYMWEHPPVEENCLNCHTPHGSNNNKLLQKKLPELCQQCHVVGQHPRTPYGVQNTMDATVPSNLNRIVGRSCANCHSNIHGSNGPHGRGTFFTR